MERLQAERQELGIAGRGDAAITSQPSKHAWWWSWQEIKEGEGGELRTYKHSKPPGSRPLSLRDLDTAGSRDLSGLGLSLTHKDTEHQKHGGTLLLRRSNGKGVGAHTCRRTRPSYILCGNTKGRWHGMAWHESSARRVRGNRIRGLPPHHHWPWSTAACSDKNGIGNPNAHCSAAYILHDIIKWNARATHHAFFF